MMLLMDLLFGVWLPPSSTGSSIHHTIGGSKKRSDTMVAKAKIMATLTDEWKNNKQISDEAGLQLNTVQQKTAKLFKAGKIERDMQKCNADTKPVCMYRKKQ